MHVGGRSLGHELVTITPHKASVAPSSRQGVSLMLTVTALAPWLGRWTGEATISTRRLATSHQHVSCPLTCVFGRGYLGTWVH